ncbi:hypothetical protein [Nocardioides kribbensis]|uniref:Phage tail tape measure protein n=1 Tax=Nocardioides kribbensis TaxID=305517 RepID=A0ABV1NZ10_9ACTN
MAAIATRVEKVVLDLEDRYSQKLLRPIAATKAMENAVKGLDGTTVNSSRSFDGAATEIEKVGTSSSKAGPEIDRLSGRLKVLADTAAILGPGLIPIGAVGVPAIAGLASQLGAAAIAGGSAIVAFQGVGDAVKAMQEYDLEPTAANLQKMQAAMAGIGPEAQEFVRSFQDFRPVLDDIRDAAARGWFPGLTESLDDFARLAPRVEALFEAVGRAGGQAVADGAESLASGRWREFFKFLEVEAPIAVTSLSRIVGDLAHGLAEMWMSFQPGNNDFTQWLEGVADGFDRWASSAEGRDDIAGFLDYVRETGPAVSDAFVSIVNAVTQIVQAAAPLGGPVLKGISAFADALAAVADSDLGTPLFVAVGAMSALSRATAIWGAASRTSVGQFVTGQKTVQSSIAATQTRLAGLGKGSTVAGIGKASAVIAGLTLASSGAADSIGLTNTMSGALIGTMAGPWGAAIGGSIGLVRDLAKSNDDLTAAIDAADRAMRSGTVPEMRARYKDLSTQLAETKNNVNDFKDLFRLSDSDGESYLANLGGAFKGLGSIISSESERGTQKLDELKFSMENTGGLSDIFAQGLHSSAGALDDAASSAADFSREVQRLNEVLTGRSNWRDYKASIDDASAALKENGRTLNNNTAEGRANNEALDNIAATALRVADTLKRADRGDFLARARQNFVNTAMDMGKTRAAAERLADGLGLIDKVKIKPKVDLDTKQAENKGRNLFDLMDELGRQKPRPKADLNANPFDAIFGDVMGDLDQLDGKTSVPRVNLNDGNALGTIQGVFRALTNLDGNTATTYINTVKTTTLRTTTGRADIPLPGALTSATGGHIQGPGTGTSDSIPAWLSNGEFVIQAKSVEHYGADFFHGLNARKYAEGGRVERTPSARFTSADYYSRTSPTARLAADADFAGRKMREFGSGVERGEKGLKAELKARQKLLEKAVEREEKEQAASKERLDALRQDAQSLRDSVASRLTSELFQQRDRITLNRPEGYDTWSIEAQQRFALMEQQLNANATISPLDTLRGDIERAREEGRLIQQLKARGLDGAALQSVIEGGNLSSAAALSRKDLRDFERLYNQRERAVGNAGESASAAVFGRELRLARKDYQEQTAEVREVKQQQRETNRRLEKLEKAMERAADKAADKVKDGMSKNPSAGQRKGRP